MSQQTKTDRTRDVAEPGTYKAPVYSAGIKDEMDPKKNDQSAD